MAAGRAGEINTRFGVANSVELQIKAGIGTSGAALVEFHGHQVASRDQAGASRGDYCFKIRRLIRRIDG